MKRSIVVSALVLALGVGIVEARAGKRHSHRVEIVYRQAVRDVHPGEAGYAIAGCPRGVAAVSASSIVRGGVPFVNVQGVDPRSGKGYALIVNEGSETSTLTITTTCIYGWTSRASAGNARALRHALRGNARALER